MRQRNKKETFHRCHANKNYRIPEHFIPNHQKSQVHKAQQHIIAQSYRGRRQDCKQPAHPSAYRIKERRQNNDNNIKIDSFKRFFEVLAH